MKELTIEVWQDALQKHWKSLNLKNGSGLNLVVELDKVLKGLERQGFVVSPDGDGVLE